MRLQEASAAHDGMLPAHLVTSSRLLTWLAARVSISSASQLCETLPEANLGIATCRFIPIAQTHLEASWTVTASRIVSVL